MKKPIIAIILYCLLIPFLSLSCTHKPQIDKSDVLFITGTEDEAAAYFPEMDIGDKFTVTSYSGEGKPDNYNAKVISVKPDGSFVVETKNEKGQGYIGYYNNSYQLVRLLDAKRQREQGIPKPTERLLKFPLFVGKTWKEEVAAFPTDKAALSPWTYQQDHDFVFRKTLFMINFYPIFRPYKGLGTSFTIKNVVNKYRVEKYESVKTEGGSFKAFKITRNQSFWLETLPWEGTDEYWYAPELKSIVKFKSSWREGWELADYRLASFIKTDVDEIPSFDILPRNKDLAVVIGIEEYQFSPHSDFSLRDAETMEKYLKALGIPNNNIQLLTNEKATGSSLEKVIEAWLPNNATRNSMIFVYYSGHGAPDPLTGKTYIVPYDGDSNYIVETGYPLRKLFAELGKLDTKKVIVVLDSCFSGNGGRSVLARGARPLVLIEDEFTIPNNVVVLTGSQANQISTSSRDKGHGILTYYFLEAIKGGKRSLGEIYDYLAPRVQDEAKRLNVTQLPSIKPNVEQLKSILLF